MLRNTSKVLPIFPVDAHHKQTSIYPMKMLNIEFTAITNGHYHDYTGVSSIPNIFEQGFFVGFFSPSFKM